MHMATKDITDLMVLKAYDEMCKQRDEDLKTGYFGHPQREWVYEILSRWTGECEKVCYRACERAEKRGYIDVGVSLRSGWLSPEGKKFLKDNL